MWHCWRPHWLATTCSYLVNSSLWNTPVSDLLYGILIHLTVYLSTATPLLVFRMLRFISVFHLAPWQLYHSQQIMQDHIDNACDNKSCSPGSLGTHLSWAVPFPFPIWWIFFHSQEINYYRSSPSGSIEFLDLYTKRGMCIKWVRWWELS